MPLSDAEMPSIFKSRGERLVYEKLFQQEAVQKVFSPTLRMDLERAKEEIQVF